MERRVEDLEKSMKRSNDKQLKIEHELCLKVCVMIAGNSNAHLNVQPLVMCGNTEVAEDIIHTVQGLFKTYWLRFCISTDY